MIAFPPLYYWLGAIIAFLGFGLVIMRDASATFNLLLVVLTGAIAIIFLSLVFGVE